MFIDVITDAFLDCVRMLPFLFGAFLLLEALEHHTSERMNRVLARAGKAGPAAGALLGCVPQCGFSVVAANLYSGGVISLGTLLAVMIATSDEAVLILLGHPGQGGEIGKLILMKVLIGTLAGYVVDRIRRRGEDQSRNMEDFCRECGCHEAHGILRPALYHTIQIFLFLLIFTAALNLTIEILGIEKISEILLADSLFQPLIAAVVGLIPNCASSVVLTQLYLSGVISFASVIAGLCTGAGLGLVVLFKMNRDKKENIRILGLLYGISAGAGLLLQMASL